jgi:hypothetical protein
MTSHPQRSDDVALRAERSQLARKAELGDERGRRRRSHQERSLGADAVRGRRLDTQETAEAAAELRAHDARGRRIAADHDRGKTLPIVLPLRGVGDGRVAEPQVVARFGSGRLSRGEEEEDPGTALLKIRASAFSGFRESQRKMLQRDLK